MQEHITIIDSFDAILLPNGTITLQESAPEVEEVKRISLELFIRILILTLLFELIIAYIICFLAKIPQRMLISVIIANIISIVFVSTLPIVITILANKVINEVEAFIVFLVFTLFTGVAIFVFEACFIYLLNKEIITLKRSFWLSLLMNLIWYHSYLSLSTSNIQLL